MIPKTHNGGMCAIFLTEKKRSDQALIALVQEKLVNGVSTGKVEKVIKSLGFENMSAGQVSTTMKKESMNRSKSSVRYL